MGSRSRNHLAHPLGLRHGGHHGEREEDGASGEKRRKRNRRGVALRVALATATIALPHYAKSETSKRSRREPVPLVTTRVEGALAVPAPYAYDALILEAAERHGVDAVLIKSIMQAESAFNALAVSRAGALGLMQLMPEVAKELGVDDPLDARQNVMGGTQYLRRLLDRYDGNVRLALAGYNAGVTNVSQYGGVPPFRETRNYVKRVTRLVEQTRREEKDLSRKDSTPAPPLKRL